MGRESNHACLNGDEHDFKNIMELPDHVNVSKNLPDLISLTKVSVVASDEILAILLRALVWGSEQINDFERTD